jgi:hypothetical protein
LEGNVQKRPRYKTLDSLYHEEFGEWGEFILEQEVFPDKFCTFLKLKVAFDLFKLDSDSIKNLVDSQWNFKCVENKGVLVLMSKESTD